MTNIQVVPPFEIFTDVNGKPLEDGYLYIGQQSLDPEANPISVFWDEALTQPAIQPIRTKGGYPSNAGAQARFYVAQTNYSVRVKNKNGTIVSADLDFSSEFEWSRSSLSSAITNAYQMLDAQPVNIFEFAALATGYVPGGNPETWNWTPAIIAAQAASPIVEYPAPIAVSTSVALSGKMVFTGGSITSTAPLLTFANPLIEAPLAKVFNISPAYTLVTVANTTTQDKQISNMTGSLANKFVQPEWFGAVPANSGAPVDSYNALYMAQWLGNLNLNALYYISTSFLFRNNRQVYGTKGRPAQCGFVIAPALVAFTGFYGIYNYETTGLGAYSSANGLNQNPYVYLHNFTVISEGISRPDSVGNPYTQIDLFLWETTSVSRISTYVRQGGAVTTPTMQKIVRIQNGPCTIRDLDIIGVENDLNIDCLSDCSVEFDLMTNMDIGTINYNMNTNRGFKFTCLKEAPSNVSTLNMERHPSHFGGNANTRPSIIAQGPVTIEDTKLSAEDPNSMGVRIVKRSAVSWEPMPTLRNITLQAKPNDPDGYFGKMVEVFDATTSTIVETFDTTWALGSGATQSVTDVSGIAFFDGGKMMLVGGSINLANDKNAERTLVRNIGTIANAATSVFRVPRSMRFGSFSCVCFRVQIGGRGASNVNYYAVGYLENVSGVTSTRVTELIGSAAWDVVGDLTAGTFTITNTTGANVSDTSVKIEFFGTPASN